MKRNIFAILTAVAIFAMTATSFAELKTATIKTSAVCGTCKTTIEKACNNADGVNKSNLDLHTKIATVVFDSKVTNKDNVKKAISNAGYMADNMKPNRKAYKKLSKHCQSGFDLKAGVAHVHEHKDCNHSTKKVECNHSTKKTDCNHSTKKTDCNHSTKKTDCNHGTKKTDCCTNSKNKKGSCCTPKK